MLDLHHQTINQTQVSPGDAEDRADSLFVGKVIRMGRETMAPTLLQKIARLVVRLRLHFMGEANP